MKYSDNELDEFVDRVMKVGWNYQVAKGNLEGSYPTTMTPSAVYKKIFKRQPSSPIDQNKLKQLDDRHNGVNRNLSDYIVTIKFGASEYKYEITDARNKSHARTIGIGKYIKENTNGHTTVKLVNSLAAKKEIVISVVEAR